MSSDAVEIRSTTKPSQQQHQHQHQQHQQQSSSSQHCLICYTPFVEPSSSSSSSSSSTRSTPTRPTNTTTTIGITPCSHNEICALCHLRLRQLHQDLSCPICKTMNELIVVDDYVKPSTTGPPNHTDSTSRHHERNQQKLYDEYPIWGNELGKEYILYQQHTFFPIQYYNSTIVPIVRYACTLPHCTFGQQQPPVPAVVVPAVVVPAVATTTSISSSASSSSNTHHTNTTLRQLQDHLRTQHTLTLCMVCTDHQRDFVSRLPRYNPSGLQKHYQQQHYTCPFCTTVSSSSSMTPFYDLNALYLHCHREHYRCHICETNLQISNEFYSNYKSLERHFETRHYLCHHPTCLTDRFIVFYTDIDLAHHERTVHHVVSSHTSKIQLEFKFHKHGHNDNHPDGHHNQNNNNHRSSSSGQSSDHRHASNINYQIDGTAFTPPALPSTSSNNININNNNNNNSSSTTSQRGDSNHLHPQHAARTEQLRQQAAALRHSGESGGSSSQNNNHNNNHHHSEHGNFEDSNMTASAFPSLQQTVTNNDDTTNNKSNPNRLTIGWTADGSRAATLTRKPAGVVTEEDFPSLVTNQSKAKTSLKIMKKAPSLSSSTSSISATSSSKGKHNGSSNGSNWTAAAASSGVTAQLPPPPIPLAYATMTTPSHTSINTMKQQQYQPNVDLSDKQSFPSLGLGNKSTMKKAAPYTAAQDFAASIRKSTPSTGTNLSLLSPLQTSATMSMTTSKATRIPDVSSVDNFPSLSISATKNVNGPNHAVNKIKRITPSTGGSSGNNATTNLSIDTMKGILGPVGYKAMKAYTREFVSHEMPADSYIDHMASLFPNGYTDVHFWNFVPELIRSFPLTADQDGAFAYMENLRRMKNGALNHEAHYLNSKVSTSTAASQKPPVTKPSTSYATLTSTYTPTPPQTSISSSYTPTTSAAAAASKVGGKPKTNTASSVWGSSGATAAASSAQPKPSSVAMATAPQLASARTGTTATSNNTSSKKKSGGGSSKQRNELRALAFGL